VLQLWPTQYNAQSSHPSAICAYPGHQSISWHSSSSSTSCQWNILYFDTPAQWHVLLATVKAFKATQTGNATLTSKHILEIELELDELPMYYFSSILVTYIISHGDGSNINRERDSIGHQSIYLRWRRDRRAASGLYFDTPAKWHILLAMVTAVQHRPETWHYRTSKHILEIELPLDYISCTRSNISSLPLEAQCMYPCFFLSVFVCVHFQNSRRQLPVVHPLGQSKWPELLASQPTFLTW